MRNELCQSGGDVVTKEVRWREQAWKIVIVQQSILKQEENPICQILEKQEFISFSFHFFSLWPQRFLFKRQSDRRRSTLPGLILVIGWRTKLWCLQIEFGFIIAFFFCPPYLSFFLLVFLCVSLFVDLFSSLNFFFMQYFFVFILLGFSSKLEK